MATIPTINQETLEAVLRSQESFRDAGHRDFAVLPEVIQEWEERALNEEFPMLSVLAHEWGDLGENAPQNVIDNELQAFVRLSLDALNRRVQLGEELNWAKVIETFNQNPFMERDPAMTTDRTRRFQTRRSYNVNLFGRSEKDEETVRDLEAWLQYELVHDPNIIEAMKIPFNKVTNIVARTGPICYKHIRLDNSRQGLNFVDVGIIRYPDFSHPYIQVYRICLEAWTSSKSKWAVLQENRSGVNGGLYVRTYRPRREAIQNALDRAQQQALSNLAAGNS